MVRREIVALPLVALPARAAEEPEEARPVPYTVRCSPADGSTTALNPPAFLWLPVKGKEGYEVQYSQDPGDDGDPAGSFRRVSA